MTYDVLDKDLYDDNKKKGKKKGKFFNMKPFWIHLGIILFFLSLIFFFFVSDITFNFGDEEKKTLTLTGKLENFNETYSGDLLISSSQFTLKTSSAFFDETGKDISIKDFKGRIFMKNNSIIFEGKASEIVFGRNKLEIKGDSFILTSQKRTNTQLYFDVLELNFEEGTLEFSKSVNFDFNKATVTLNDFNATMNYDGKYVFSGEPSTFALEYPKDNLKLEFNGKENK